MPNRSPNYGHNYFPNLDCTWILSPIPFKNSTSASLTANQTEVAEYSSIDDGDEEEMSEFLADLKMNLQVAIYGK